jgi:hypothetical protein
MKKVLFAILTFLTGSAEAQITYINITNHNIGSGSNNVFNQYITPTSEIFIDYEVGASGVTSANPCGTKTSSRVVLRRMASNDPSSVIASAPIYVTGICNGKSGNYDKYFVNLKSAVNGIAGRYSVEIQADVLPSANPYDNSNTRTTWNYMCPPSYYLTAGTSGSTGNYYTPPSGCSLSGASDPIGGTLVDKMQEINPSLRYFTVGDAGAYRQMLVLSGIYYDLENGKFQPGNPNIPVSIDGIGSIPLGGICPNNPAPALSLGAEVNVFKRNGVAGCTADVTGSRLYYRVYKTTATAPSYSFLNIGFSDNCPNALGVPAGSPEGNLFPGGGSCQNLNNILDQRWRTNSSTEATNILPSTFSSSDIGTWRIDFYIETYLKNCSGTTSTQTSSVQSTEFSVKDPTSSGIQCGTVTSAENLMFRGEYKLSKVLLNWNLQEILAGTQYEVQFSLDGRSFTTKHLQIGNAIQKQFSYQENALFPRQYYRLKITAPTGKISYSYVVSIQTGSNPSNQLVYPNPLPQNQLPILQLGQSQLKQWKLINAMGQLIDQGQNVNQSGSFPLPLHSPIKNGIYYLQLITDQGVLKQKLIVE